MPTCSAFNCTYKHVKTSGKTVHTFPFSRPEILGKWINNVKRENWHPSKRSLLCSDHFEEDCFDRSGLIVRLKPDAVPTKFDFPLHLIKKCKGRKAPLQRLLETESGAVETYDTPNLEPQQQVSKDHTYNESPRKLKRKLEKEMEQSSLYQKKLKVKQQRIRRLVKKVHSMNELVDHLSEKQLVGENAAHILKKSFSGAPLELLTRMIKNKDGKLSREKYPPSLRSFALTLQFYSSRAYDYVRSTFNFALPHPSVLRQWYSCIEGEPGFSSEAFRILKSTTELAAVNGEKIACSFMLDEMSIRHHVQFDGREMRGYVDLGSKIEDDDVPIASNALIFMVVCLHSNWKIPVAYFFINGLSGEERANLVTECLIRLYDVKVEIPSITFDGPSCHFSMARHLGAAIDLPDPQPWFRHPSNPAKRVFVIFDVCHMLKLIRNNWASIQIFKDSVDNKEIKWQYVASLHKLQEKEGLRAANKLRSAHIQWHQQKMKVNLAAQTLSSSVADALEFCNKDLKFDEFKNCEKTVYFIRTIDKLFDILNSRNPIAKGFKAPLRIQNAYFWRPFLQEALALLVHLTDPGGILMYETPKKTPFVGFYISTLSLMMLYDELVASETPILKYMLTYKFSQDHLELFISAIRCRGGWNNNPTAVQFISAYKRLLMHHEITSKNGNVISQENVRILNVVKEKRSDSSKNQAINYSLNHSLAKKYDMALREPVESDHDYCDIPKLQNLNEFSENIVNYIAGYVVRMVEKRVFCEECIAALQGDPSSASCLDLLMRKTRGGLIFPSKGVISVCQSTERCFRRMLNSNSGKPPQQKNFSDALSLVVLKDVCNRRNDIFPSLKNHMFDSTPLDNHVFSLIKIISNCYVKIRMYHLSRCHSESANMEKIRKKFTKLILFKHQ